MSRVRLEECKNNIHAKQSKAENFLEKYKTRKSSCVDARGILTVTYQVLHLLTEVGYPPLGVPPIQVWPRGYLRWGTPLIGVTPHWGIPQSRSNWGYLRWGPPVRGTPLVRVPPLGYPSVGVPEPGPAWGYPNRGYPPAGPGLGTPSCLDLAWVPPPGVDRLKTLPSLILRMQSVIRALKVIV